MKQTQSQDRKVEQPNTQSQNIFQQITTQKLVVSPTKQIQNSRILNRKQIQKRLQNLKPAEYQKVINNLTSQNKVLQTQVRNLHEKVEQLMISKKLPNPHHKNPLLQEQVRKTKKQLALKYQSMNYLKQQIRKIKQTQLTQQMRNRINEYKNQIAGIDIQVQRLLKEKQSLQYQYNANSESIEQYIPKTQNRDQKMNSLKQQNKVLRSKILQFNEKSKTTLKSSQSALQKFYNLKQQEQKFIKALIETKTSKKKLTNSDVKSFNVTEFTALQKQVQDLKKQKKQAEKQLVNQKIIKDQKKVKLQKEARENIQIHKQLLKKRMKLLNQLNLYQAKDRRQRQIIQQKQYQLKQIQCQQRGSQTDKIVPIDFRKEWIGGSEGIVFDDSQILDYRSHVYIKSLIIYKTADFIGFVKFFYENTQKKRYETKIPFDASILRKFQSKKYTPKGQSFLKNFKLYLTNERITKIQFIWSDGEVSVQGWQNQGSTKFTADIDPHQRPISMFGTLSFQGKNSYALESLGCQINKIQNDE